MYAGKVTHSKILLWHILFAVTFTNTSKVCGLTDSFLYTPHILITQWFISANLTVKRWHVLSSLTQHWAHMLKVRVIFEGYCAKAPQFPINIALKIKVVSGLRKVAWADSCVVITIMIKRSAHATLRSTRTTLLKMIYWFLQIILIENRTNRGPPVPLLEVQM